MALWIMAISVVAFVFLFGYTLIKTSKNVESKLNDDGEEDC